MEISYCSTCSLKTNWIEYETYWQCQVCKKVTKKMTYEECQIVLENIQEKWSKIEQSIPTDHWLNNYKSTLHHIMDKADQTLYHVEIINGTDNEGTLGNLD